LLFVAIICGILGFSASTEHGEASRVCGGGPAAGAQRSWLGSVSIAALDCNCNHQAPERRMTRQPLPAADAAWLHMDRPTNPMVVNGLVMLGEDPDPELLAQTLERRLTSAESQAAAVPTPAQGENSGASKTIAEAPLRAISTARDLAGAALHQDAEALAHPDHLSRLAGGALEDLSTIAGLLASPAEPGGPLRGGLSGTRGWPGLLR
jgi:hypothetical protein